MVFVLDRKKRPLMPCTEKRARLLLARGRARVHRMRPFTIRLRDRQAAECALQSVVLKFDPGSRTTGATLVREEETAGGPVHHALHLAEIYHRGEDVRCRMIGRAGYRKRRRNANLRHRPPRFDNRTRPKGWLPPSLQSRVDNILSWTRRYMKLAPIARVGIELAKFDTQALQNPEISGAEYQHGELFGYEVKEYLLEKFGRKCAYCDGLSGDPVLEVEHIVPPKLGGSNRVSNLTIACDTCNNKKGKHTPAMWTQVLAASDEKIDRVRLENCATVQARAKAPLKDAAAVNSTRWAAYNGLRAMGFPVRSWTGGRTKWNRTRLGLPKTHALDALCIGELAGVTGSGLPVLGIKATGRGQRRRTNVDASGFPRGYRMRRKRVRGFQTGDKVRANMPAGKYAGTHAGRVAVRASGSFRVGRADGISWRHCRLIQRADGYEYMKGGSGASSSGLKPGASGAA